MQNLLSYLEISEGQIMEIFAVYAVNCDVGMYNKEKTMCTIACRVQSTDILMLDRTLERLLLASVGSQKAEQNLCFCGFGKRVVLRGRF